MLVLSLFNQQVDSLELRYKVCTAEELRRSVEQVCMRLGRDANSLLSLGPYGSIASGIDSGGLSSDAALLEILKMSRPYVPGRMRTQVKQLSQQLFKRSQESSGAQFCDYLDSCCNQSCVIDPEDLAPYCTTI